MKPLVSIVMAVYQGERYLADQIHSILDQTYKNIELVIVDDGSADNTVQIVEEFARKDSRIKTYRNPQNLGIVRNFIDSLRFAGRGKLFCFSDQDDVWRQDKIEILVSLILKDSRNMLAYSDLEICDENLKTTHKSFWRTVHIKPRSGMVRELALLRNIIPGCSMMFRKEVRDLLIGTPNGSSLLHDHLAFVIASSLGRSVYSAETLVKYRQHQRNNIGAFYPAVSNRKHLKELLGKEIKTLRQFLPIDLQSLERFLNEDTHKNILSRLRNIRYYLFLRNNHPLDQALGILECMAPRSYALAKKMGRTEDLCVLIKRVIFIGWTILVLSYFVGQFIGPKINRFLSWI